MIIVLNCIIFLPILAKKRQSLSYNHSILKMLQLKIVAFVK